MIYEFTTIIIIIIINIIVIITIDQLENNFYIIQAAMFTPTYQIWFVRYAVLGMFLFFCLYIFFLLSFLAFLKRFMCQFSDHLLNADARFW